MAALGAALLLVAACGGDTTFPEGSFAVVASSDLGTGQSRILVGVVGPEGERLGSPVERVTFELTPIQPEGPPQRYDAAWMWLIPEVVGLYRATADFPTPGVWTVGVIPEPGPELEPVPFEVRADTFAPNLGDPAPVAPLQTLAEAPLESLTTDPDPDEDFYRLTMEEAFTSGKKTVVVFATPAFCTSATCGPALDVVKAVKPEHPDVNYIHVEVYTDINTPDFTPTPEHLSPAVGPQYWNLPSEPWVFVVDAAGQVTARFEGSVTPEELRTALS
jgi:hypothetical protein